MRIHYNLCEAVVQALSTIFQEKQYADRVVEKVLKSNNKWGARDRGFIAEHVYEAVRYLRLLQNIVPDPENFWQLLGALLVLEGKELPEWENFAGLYKKQIIEKKEAIKPIRKLRESIPDWLDEMGENELGEGLWNRTIASLNQPAPLVLRTNTLKISRNELIKALAKENIEAIANPEIAQALVLQRRQNVFATQSFQKGYFEVQDNASQMVGEYLQAEAGMTVVDACAGAGGKTLDIAVRMKNKGNIIALDTETWKLKEAERRAKRAGVSILTHKLIEKNTIQSLYNSADRLLLDVPCSGLGVLRRNPDAKWKLKPDFIENIRDTQKKILYDYSPICKVGGRMVYATCSILPSENQDQITEFLKTDIGKSFELVAQKSIFPFEKGYDGFFIAVLNKNS